MDPRRPAVALPPPFQDLFTEWRPEYKVVFWTAVFTLQKLLIHSEHKALRGFKGHTNFFLFFIFLPSVMKAILCCSFRKVANP